MYSEPLRTTGRGRHGLDWQLGGSKNLPSLSLFPLEPGAKGERGTVPKKD